MAIDERHARERLWNLIRDIRFGMFITRENDGTLHAHPMTLQNKDLDDTALYFFMSRRGEPFGELQSDPRVGVAFSDASEDKYVSVSGRAGERNDDLRHKLWSKMTQAWFPGGPDDPDLALVEVRIDAAHYWDVRESQPVQLYKMAKAVLTGTTPTDLGESREVPMR